MAEGGSVRVARLTAHRAKISASLSKPLPRLTVRRAYKTILSKPMEFPEQVEALDLILPKLGAGNAGARHFVKNVVPVLRFWNPDTPVRILPVLRARPQIKISFKDESSKTLLLHHLDEVAIEDVLRQVVGLPQYQLVNSLQEVLQTLEAESRQQPATDEQEEASEEQQAQAEAGESRDLSSSSTQEG